jgi:hypothetical protein
VIVTVSVIVIGSEIVIGSMIVTEKRDSYWERNS